MPFLKPEFIFLFCGVVIKDLFNFDDHIKIDIEMYVKNHNSLCCNTVTSKIHS